MILQALMGIPALVPAYLGAAGRAATRRTPEGTGPAEQRDAAVRAGAPTRRGATVRAAAILALLFLASCGDGGRTAEFYFYNIGVRVVGPFASEDECQKIRWEIRVGSSTSCWRGR